MIEITQQVFVLPGSSDKLWQIKPSNTAVLIIWLYYFIFYFYESDDLQ